MNNRTRADIGTNQGRDCLGSLNATRRVFHLPPVEGVCTTCERVGTCVIPQACEKPVAELRPIRRRFTARRSWLPQTQEGWGKLIGASLGAGGFVLFAISVGRAWGFW